MISLPRKALDQQDVLTKRLIPQRLTEYAALLGNGSGLTWHIILENAGRPESRLPLERS